MATVIDPPVRGKAEIPREPIRRFTVDEYHFLIEAGILDEDDNVELLEGYVVEKTSKNRLHTIVNQLLNEYFQKVLQKGWFVQAQEPITTETSEPEPDISVVRGQLFDYLLEHPRSSDVSVVVEVSDSSLRRDRTTKMRIYASACVPEYWIVNLSESQFEIYSDPSGPITNPAYRQQKTYGRGTAFDVRLDGEIIATLAIDDLLP